MSDFGDRIKEARKNRNMSMQDLADAVGISKSAIGQIETGTNKGSKYLSKIAEVLLVDPAWIQFGISDREETNLRLSESEVHLISIYRQLNESDREVILRVGKGLLKETIK
jgi:transcriptional regulator with XRE-family HTH domain